MALVFFGGQFKLARSFNRNERSTVLFRPHKRLPNSSRWCDPSSRWFSEDNPLDKDKPTESKAAPKVEDDLAALLSVVLNIKTSPIKPANQRPSTPRAKPISIPLKMNQPSVPSAQPKTPNVDLSFTLDKLLEDSKKVYATPPPTPTPTIAKKELIPGEKTEDQLLDELLKTDFPTPSLNRPRPDQLRGATTISTSYASRRYTPNRVFSSGGRLRPKKSDVPGYTDLGEYGDDRFQRGRRKDQFNIEFGRRGGRGEVDIKVMIQDTESMIRDYAKHLESDRAVDKKVMERCRKSLDKRWKNLAKIRKARKTKRGPKENIPPGSIHPTFTEGFGAHFTHLFKKVNPDHKLFPIMQFYARKLAHNGTWSWEQRYKGMKFLLKFLNKPVQADFIPGVTDVHQPLGTENEPAINHMERRRKFLEAPETETKILKEGQIEEDEEEPDIGSIFQEEEGDTQPTVRGKEQPAVKGKEQPTTKAPLFSKKRPQEKHKA